MLTNGRLSVMASSLMLLAAATVVLPAATIPVPNGSFESPSTTYAYPIIDSWEATGFTWYDQIAGVFFNAPPTNAANAAVFLDNCDGNQAAFLFAAPQVGLLQDYGSVGGTNTAPDHAFNVTFDVGKSYALTVGLIGSSVEPLSSGATLLLSLYYRDGSNNVVIVAATTVAYQTNVFTNLTHLLDFSVTVPTVKAGDAWAGQHLGISLLSTVSPALEGGVWDLDNVRLSSTMAPVLANPTSGAGQCSFVLQSEPGSRVEILASAAPTSPLTQWTSLGIVTNTTGRFPFSDTAAIAGSRFYSARSLP